MQAGPAAAVTCSRWLVPGRQPRAAVRRPGHWQQAAVAGWMRWRPKAAVAGCAGGRGASRAEPGTAGNCISFRPPTLPEEGEGEGKFGRGDEHERRQRFSPTIIRAAGGTCCRGPFAACTGRRAREGIPVDALRQQCARSGARCERSSARCARSDAHERCAVRVAR